MNQGYTATEISNMLDLPPSLAQEFYNRDYYGTVSHNVRAVYNFYLGYFDGVPANLNPQDPETRARKYMNLAGGPDGLMRLPSMPCKRAIIVGRRSCSITSSLLIRRKKRRARFLPMLMSKWAIRPKAAVAQFLSDGCQRIARGRCRWRQCPYGKL